MQDLKMNQTLELNHLGMLPLSENETSETTGGVFWVIPLVLGALIGSALSVNLDDFRDGYSDGLNGTPRY
jgi:hypothetical protein